MIPNGIRYFLVQGMGHPTCTDSVLVTISKLNCRQGKVYAIEAEVEICFTYS